MIFISKFGKNLSFLSALLLIQATFLFAEDSHKIQLQMEAQELGSSVQNQQPTSPENSVLEQDQEDLFYDNEIQLSSQDHEQTTSVAKAKLSKITMGLLTAARQSLDNGDYEVAEEAYKQSLQQEDISSNISRVTKVQLQLARLLKKMKKNEEALKIYGNIASNHHKPEVKLEYIRLLHSVDRNDKALDLCQSLLKKFPSFFKAELTAGMITKSKGDYMRSLLHFDKYLSVRPEDPVALLETGNLLEKMQKWKQAKALYDRLIKLEPDNSQALRNRGNSLVHLGEYKLAVADLSASGMSHIPWVERLIRYAKSQIDIAVAKAESKRRSESQTEILFTKDISEIQAKSNSLETSVITEESHMKSSDSELTIASTSKQILRNTDSVEDTTPSSDSKASMLAKLDSINFIEFTPQGISYNDSEGPDFVLDDETTDDASFIDTHGASNDDFTTKDEIDINDSLNPIENDGNISTSEDSEHESVTKKNARDNYVTLPTKGMELIQARDFQKALPILRLEIKRFPQNLEISQALRVALQSMSLFDEILQELDRIITLYPESYDLQLNRSYYLLESGNVAASLKTNLKENDPYALYLKAMAMRKIGRLKDATVIQERLKTIDSRFSDQQTGKFLWLVRLQDYLFAYPLGKKLIKANRPWLCYPMAVVARALDYPVEAVLYLTQSVQDDPQNSKAYFELSQIMDQLGRPEDRDVFLQKALSIEPSNSAYKTYHQQLALKAP